MVLTLGEIAKALGKVPVIGCAKDALNRREWKRFLEGTQSLDQEECLAMQGVWKMRDELSDGTPPCLWDRVVELPHQGHQVAAKTKARLRAKVWFPGRDTMVDILITRCYFCAITAIDQPTAR
ncbi:hypothetical protein NDU88_005205 [Pleurodeles waltl]|uniref:Integrase zinc-binding domain-containing protein n=1 Tax=Pleurodeles waltl TaxID=8319 RepID=A0AAV7TAL2_PLEWA|nr:hypothetical protein NDU88_005205 [Pleurodeles waltl]